MKCPRRLARLVIGVVTVPFLLWIVILTLVPTDCTRNRLAAILARETGRVVRIERIKLGFMGGVCLENLEIAEPERKDDPWLRVAELELDVNLSHIVLGRVEPSNVVARGAVLRVQRRPNGSFEFGDLLRARRSRTDTADYASRDAGELDSQSVHFRLTDARLALIDDRTGTRLEITDLHGTGNWKRFRTTVEALSGRVNGGAFEVTAELDRGPGDPMFEGEVKLDNVGLGANFGALGYAVPFLSPKNDELDRRLDLELYLRGHGATSESLASSLVGQGTLHVRPIALDTSPLFAQLDKIGLVPSGKRVGSVQSTFAVRDEKIRTNDLTILVAHSPIVLAGTTDFTGRIDYRIRADTLSTRLGQDLRGILADVPADLEDLIRLRVQGRLDNLEVTLDGVPIDKVAAGDPVKIVTDKAKLRELGRKLRNRILR